MIAGTPRVEVVHMDLIVGGSFRKARKDGAKNRLVIFSPFPKFTGHVGLGTLGKHCVLVKKINEMDEGKEPTERWFPLGAGMNQKMSSSLATDFSHGLTRCTEGGGEDGRTKVKDGELPVHQPMSGSPPCGAQ